VQKVYQNNTSSEGMNLGFCVCRITNNESELERGIQGGHSSDCHVYVRFAELRYLISLKN
jgi:hypothetical protein